MTQTPASPVPSTSSVLSTAARLYLDAMRVERRTWTAEDGARILAAFYAVAGVIGLAENAAIAATSRGGAWQNAKEWRAPFAEIPRGLQARMEMAISTAIDAIPAVDAPRAVAALQRAKRLADVLHGFSTWAVRHPRLTLRYAWQNNSKGRAVVTVTAIPVPHFKALCRALLDIDGAVATARRTLAKLCAEVDAVYRDADDGGG